MGLTTLATMTHRAGFWAGVVVFVLTVVGGAWLTATVVDAIGNRDAMPIARVKTFGTRHFVSDADIQAALALDGGLASLMMQDMNVVKARVEALPWVSRVSVRRTWPDAISLFIVEQHPVARWNDNALLNDEGQSFVVSDRERAGELPQLFGPAGSEAKVLAGWRSYSALLADGGHQVRDVALSNRHAWRVTLADGVELRLGRDDGINRLDRFMKVFGTMPESDRTRMAYVDLRYDTGLAVGWKPTGDEPGKQKQKGS